MTNQKPVLRSLLTPAVIVAALGYFVDIYDLLLFGIVRKASLIDLGITGDAIRDKGEFLISMQMYGMLLGGILWGILGALLIVPVMASVAVIFEYLRRRVLGFPPFDDGDGEQFNAPPEKIAETDATISLERKEEEIK